MKRVLLGAISFCMLLSCSSHGDKKANVEYKYASMKDGILHLDLDKARKDSKQINISDLCDDIIYIPLEANKKCLISDSDSRLYKIDGEDLFIRDNGNLYHFNTKGEFLGQFGKKGRGINEFWCGDICLDKENNFVFAYDSSKKRVMKYDYSGKLLSDKLKCDFSTLMYVPTSKSFVGSKLYSLIKDDKNEYNILLEMNKKGDVVDKVVSKYYPDVFFNGVDNTGLSLLGSSIYSFRDNVYAQELASDTVFMKTNEGMKPHIILNNKDFESAFNSKEIGPSKITGMVISISSDIISGYSSVSAESDRFVFIGRNGNLHMYDKIERQFSISIPCTGGEHTASRYVYDKVKHKLSMSIPFGGDEDTDSSFFFNDMDGISHLKDIQLVNNEYLVTSIQAVDLLDYIEESKGNDSKYHKRLTELAKGMTGESNPVLVLARLKK